MVAPDGTLNQAYFRPPRGARLHSEAARVWTPRERGLLIQGIQTYGIGFFREISENLLPEWSANDLRVKTMRLIGRQNLQLYKNWRGGEAQIHTEFERNRQIGQRFGTWKNNMLVYDDEGKVLDALLRDQPGQGPFGLSDTGLSKRKRDQ
ncbi:hypothetical protein HK105_203467 [Polyrhizophydium stewartii]|uniref:Uncharacterized protein n=1 Tax=Polyrhizophydium stewartii TaxID=2732419 RepID=A0ABR4NBX5_9FUNG